MKEYSGPLDRHKMDQLSKKAYCSYTHQVSRCNNVKNNAYKNYGLKGISVEYKPRQFITWFLNEYKNFDKSIQLKFVDVGRIDHSKSYSFDNIRLESRSSNAKERNERLGIPSHKGYADPIIVENIITGVRIFYQSVKDASKDYSVHRTTISRWCKSEFLDKNGFKFKYFNEEVLCL